jgi:dTDP-4-dehydrorhamnose reductase
VAATAAAAVSAATSTKNKGGEESGSGRVYNMGGPQRMSRVDMAIAVAAKRGHAPSLIVPVPAASVDRGVASPSDISMDSSELEERLGWSMTRFSDGLHLVFPSEVK